MICHDDGERFSGRWWCNRFTAAMDKAGIDARARNLKPHGLRHSLNTLLRDAGQDPAKIRAALGWTTEQVQDAYTHWNAEHLREGAAVVDRLFNEKAP